MTVILKNMETYVFQYFVIVSVNGNDAVCHTAPSGTARQEEAERKT